jgi:DNA-binding NarL/FixJ family response regulator
VSSEPGAGQTDERKTKAREVAEKSQFFKFAHLTARREQAPFLKTEAIEHLGVNAKVFGKKFDERVRALAAKGLSFRAIARVLNVAHTTVLERTTRRRKGKPRAAG